MCSTVWCSTLQWLTSSRPLALLPAGLPPPLSSPQPHQAFLAMQRAHYTLHCTLYIVHCTQYTIQCTVYSVQSVQCPRGLGRWGPGAGGVARCQTRAVYSSFHNRPVTPCRPRRMHQHPSRQWLHSDSDSQGSHATVTLKSLSQAATLRTVSVTTVFGFFFGGLGYNKLSLEWCHCCL